MLFQCTDNGLLYGFLNFRRPVFFTGNLVNNHREVSGLLRIGKEAAVTDTRKTFGRYMKKISPDEFMHIHGDHALVSVIFIVAAGNGYILPIIFNDSAVGDGSPECVAGKIFNGIAVPLECTDNMGNPFRAAKFLSKCRPFPGIVQVIQFTGESELFLSVQV